MGCVDASLSTCIIAGCYDGSLKILGKFFLNTQCIFNLLIKIFTILFSFFFKDPYNLSVLSLTTAHNHPMKALKVVESPNNQNIFSIFTAGKDHMINGFQIEKNSKYCISQVSKMAGHSNSVESLDASVSLGLLFSGDWNGNILAWDMKPTLDAVAHPKSEGPEKKKKKIISGASVSTEIKSVSHLYMIKAHSQAVSGLQISSSHNSIYTCSYDHTIRIFDIQQQDCISTFNSSKVCFTLDSSPRNNLIATSHPDGKVRIWDSRNPNNTESFGAYGSSHSWVARVKWAPDSEFIFSSICYDGSMHLWDLRSSVPLNTIEELHSGKGLCMDWLVESKASNKEKLHIVTGGSDCMIKSSEATIY